MRRGEIRFWVLLVVMWALPLGLAWGQVQQKPVQKQPTAQEPDLDKRADALIAFMDKYPKSKLQPYIVAAQQTLAYDFREKKQYDKLISLSERWLKFFPGDLQTIAYIAEAASQTGNRQKYVEYALKIYAVKPTGSLAFEIAAAYKASADEARYLEWIGKVFEYPEYAGDFKLRMDLMDKYMGEKNLAKAAECAQLTLKSLAAAKKPDAAAEADWQKVSNTVRWHCNFTIAMNHYQAKRYAQAIAALEEALRAEVRDSGFYYIGLSQWKMELIEEAQISFAATELLKGQFQDEAKEYLEKLYRSQHNNTIIGIDKVYKKAQAWLAGVRTASK